MEFIVNSVIALLQLGQEAEQAAKSIRNSGQVNKFLQESKCACLFVRKLRKSLILEEATNKRDEDTISLDHQQKPQTETDLTEEKTSLKKHSKSRTKLLFANEYKREKLPKDVEVAGCLVFVRLAEKPLKDIDVVSDVFVTSSIDQALRTLSLSLKHVYAPVTKNTLQGHSVTGLPTLLASFAHRLDITKPEVAGTVTSVSEELSYWKQVLQEEKSVSETNTETTEATPENQDSSLRGLVKVGYFCRN